MNRKQNALRVFVSSVPALGESYAELIFGDRTSNAIKAFGILNRWMSRHGHNIPMPKDSMTRAEREYLQLAEHIMDFAVTDSVNLLDSYIIKDIKEYVYPPADEHIVSMTVNHDMLTDAKNILEPAIGKWLTLLMPIPPMFRNKPAETKFRSKTVDKLFKLISFQRRIESKAASFEFIYGNKIRKAQLDRLHKYVEETNQVAEEAENAIKNEADVIVLRDVRAVLEDSIYNEISFLHFSASYEYELKCLNVNVTELKHLSDTDEEDDDEDDNKNACTFKYFDDVPDSYEDLGYIKENEEIQMNDSGLYRAVPGKSGAVKIIGNPMLPGGGISLNNVIASAKDRPSYRTKESKPHVDSPEAFLQAWSTMKEVDRPIGILNAEQFSMTAEIVQVSGSVRYDDSDTYKWSIECRICTHSYDNIRALCSTLKSIQCCNVTVPVFLDTIDWDENSGQGYLRLSIQPERFINLNYAMTR